MSEKPWCVAQILSPFGVRIDSQHWTHFGAEWRTHGFRRYGVRVMRTKEARALNRKIQEDTAHMFGFSADDVLLADQAKPGGSQSL